MGNRKASRRDTVHPLLDRAKGVFVDLAAAVEDFEPRLQARRHAVERVLVFKAGNRAKLALVALA